MKKEILKNRYFLFPLFLFFAIVSAQPAPNREIPLNIPFILDLHSDILTAIYKSRTLAQFENLKMHSSLPHLKEGGINAQFFAVWVPPGYGFKRADSMIRLFYQMLDNYSGDMAFAGSNKEIRRNCAMGKISALLGIEGGGEAIGADINNIDYFYNNGVRYMSLTWNKSNRLADAAMDKRKPHNGLSPLGKQAVQRMNQLGMIIDVSHASSATVEDILKLSRDPIIASHSCCYSLRRHPRNLTDNQIKAICLAGGVIGVSFHRKHLTAKNKATVSDVANHIDHLKKTGGLACVALGSDFDGDIIPPVGLENAGKLSNLTKELVKRGYSEEEIEQIYGQNILRVLQKVVDERPQK